MTATSDGQGLVQLNRIGTAVFAVTAVLAAVIFDGAVKVLAVVVCLVLFAIGVWTFLWGYWSAVQRSRVDQIAVSQLYFLSGSVVHRSQKRTMLVLLAVQCAVGLGTALARPNTGDSPGSTLAFGILVPMFGLGLNGLLAAHHGTFLPRDVPPSDDEIGQNASHG